MHLHNQQGNGSGENVVKGGEQGEGRDGNCEESDKWGDERDNNSEESDGDELPNKRRKVSDDQPWGADGLGR